MLENGLDFCTCPKTNCERPGLCQQCIQYHAKKVKNHDANEVIDSAGEGI